MWPLLEQLLLELEWLVADGLFNLYRVYVNGTFMMVCSQPPLEQLLLELECSRLRGG